MSLLLSHPLEVWNTISFFLKGLMSYSVLRLFFFSLEVWQLMKAASLLWVLLRLRLVVVVQVDTSKATRLISSNRLTRLYYEICRYSLE